MDKIPFLIEDNFFTEEELTHIWAELDFLNRPDLLLEPPQTGSALTNDGEAKKRNKGVFLESLYKYPEVSALWQASRKLFTSYTVRFSELHLANKTVLGTNHSTMLMSYYEDGDLYLPHRDRACVTTLYWFFREPRRFEGGELTFTDTGEVIELKNNRMIMFPSWAEHSVSQVSMPTRFQNQKLGRYCVTHFLFNAT